MRLVGIIFIICGLSLFSSPVRAGYDTLSVQAKGQWLYRYDAATTAATDALVKERVPLDGPGLYIAREDSGGAWTVYFGAFDPAARTFAPRYVEERASGSSTYHLNRDAKGDAALSAEAAAITDALDSVRAPKDMVYGYAADVERDNTIVVYLYPISLAQKGIYIWGADFALHFDASGKHQLGIDELHHGFVALTINHFQHSSDPYYARSGTDGPQVTDVFLAMQLRAPLYIQFASGVYRIEGDGRIHPDTEPKVLDSEWVTIE